MNLDLKYTGSTEMVYSYVEKLMFCPERIGLASVAASAS